MNILYQIWMKNFGQQLTSLIEQPIFTKAYFSETNDGKVKTEIERITSTNLVNPTRLNFNHCRGSLVA